MVLLEQQHGLLPEQGLRDLVNSLSVHFPAGFLLVSFKPVGQLQLYLEEEQKS